jgi:S1-C subfamily serine protease
MNTSDLVTLSEQLANAVARVTPSIVQVHGRRRPGSGIAFSSSTVLTTARALGREDGVRVRTHDGRTVDAELIGWDPATRLVVLRADTSHLTPASMAENAPRVGHLAVAVARSWSNAITATAGIISVIGGPLPTGPGRAIEQVIRTDALMHEGFAGGALIDASGAVLGTATAAAIRGLTVVVPASIAWKTASQLIEHGTPRLGFFGVAVQPVRLNERDRPNAEQDRALLVVAVTPESPAEQAGVRLGDVILRFDGQRVAVPEDLLSLLTAERVGRTVAVAISRGGTMLDVNVTVGERRRS